MRSLLCVMSVFLVLTFFAGDLYSLVARPLLIRLGPESSMIATQVASTFIAPIKLAFYLSVFVAMPYLLYQAWAFIAPGLYKSERRFVLPLLIVSIILFYAGIAFAFFVIFPIIFGFFTTISPEGVTMMTDISQYLDFVMKLFLAFGLAFEVPVVTIMLTYSGMVSVKTLKQYRPYIIIGAFVIGMLLTPPDVLSQLLLAVPMWLLFELGLLLSNFYAPGEASEHDPRNQQK
jgi:sec-independent protein translocase protein TatC